MQAKAPDRYCRRILLAVTGLSPQVVTETLYAVAVENDPPFMPSEIHLLTTGEGAERAQLTLLHQQTGWFQRLCHDYALSGIKFDPDDIHILSGAENSPLEDIRSPRDNEAAADTITEQVREFTSDPNSAVHVSIAGGRKTMGFFAGYALSLYGRVQDRLSHVLVSAPFESHPDFYYPTPYSRVIFTQGPDSRPLDTQNARVTLAEIPFVRLRDGLPKRLLEGRASFSDTVMAAQRALEPPSLLIDARNRRIVAGEETVCLAPADLAFYSWMARRRMNARHPVRWTSEGIREEYLAEYADIVGKWSGDYERVETALKDGVNEEWFEQRKAKTNAALRAGLGEQLAKPYLITAKGQRPGTRFGLALAKGAIRFSGPTGLSDE
ncbi:MAG: CRISPR-associated ring nuclease Csm6 [Pseudomonadota bacterium]